MFSPHPVPLVRRLAFAAAAGFLKAAAADAPKPSYVLAGTLYLSPSGWLLLSVPNDLVRGVFKALTAPGAELPANPEGRLEAHVSVMSKKEVEQVGADKITERGRQFHYSLGQLVEVAPDGWPDVRTVYFLKVYSPALQLLRMSYGLSPLPDGGRKAFHVTVGRVRKGVTGRNETSKVAAAGDRLAEARAAVRAVADAGADLAGIYAYYNAGPPQLALVDVTDWGDGESGKRVGRALSKVVGDEARVVWQNEGAKPSGAAGWKRVYPEPGPKTAAADLPGPSAADVLCAAGLRADSPFAKVASLADDLELVIDRPKGFKKTFTTPAGPVEKAYPVDYGYVPGTLNPDDNEYLDVFRGSGGPRFGRFMKGNNLSGAWQPDERKWYAGLTDDEHAAVLDLFESQSPGLLRDHAEFPDLATLLADVREHGRPGEEKAAELYHGSPRHGLAELDPRPSAVIGDEAAVFATPDRDLAVASLAPWTDADFEQGYVGDAPYMREKYPGAFDKTYKGKAGTLYTVAADGFVPDPRLMRAERVSRSAAVVQKSERIADALAALRKTRFALVPHGGELPGEKAAALITVDEVRAHAEDARVCAACGSPNYSASADRCVDCDQTGTKPFEPPAEATAPRPKIVGVDFDGTLAETVTPFDPDAYGAPRPGIVALVRALHREGVKVVVWTVRGDADGVKDWLKTHKVPFDWVNECPHQPANASAKLRFDAYIGDEAVSALDPAAAEAAVRALLDEADA